MLGMAQSTPPLFALSKDLPQEEFCLVDVGCSGGVDPRWRALAPRFRAIGFDINRQEVERLNLGENDDKIRYVAGPVGGSPAAPFARVRGGRPNLNRNPWGRLSVWASQAIREARAPFFAWREPLAPETAYPAEAPASPSDLIIVPEYLDRERITSVDFLKIDIDGGDLEVADSFRAHFDRMQILGVGVEVNFFGSDHPTDHTFHNMDRMLRQCGFDLYGLETWRYSTSALPSRYTWGGPGPTQKGRILQGDAFYLRDLCAPQTMEFARQLTPIKLFNASLIAALFDQPDVAAEIILRNRDAISSIVDVERALDLLANQLRGDDVSYKDHMAAFVRDDSSFY
jgi:hypothetical protein